MTYPGPEKRRVRRIVPPSCFLRLVMRVPVMVRDIGQGGAQLETSVAVPPRSSAQLQTMLHGRPFLPEVEVPWSAASQGPDVPSCRMGIHFATMTDDSRKALASFLVTAPDRDA